MDAGKGAYIPAFIGVSRSTNLAVSGAEPHTHSFRDFPISGELRAACPPDRIVMMEQLRRLAVTVNFTLAEAEEEMIALGDVRDAPQLPVRAATALERADRCAFCS